MLYTKDGILRNEAKDLSHSLDLGQAVDYSAHAVVQVHWAKRPRDDLFHLRFLDRWPLRTPYEQVVHDTKQRLGKDEGRGFKPYLIADFGGPGPYIMETFRAEGLNSKGLLLTAGHHPPERSEKFNYVWHVPRRAIITRLQVLVQNNQLLYPRAGMPLAETLLNELRGLKQKQTVSGNDIFVHREGDHDDLILAVAGAVFQAEQFLKRRPSSAEVERHERDPRPFQPPSKPPFELPDDFECSTGRTPLTIPLRESGFTSRVLGPARHAIATAFASGRGLL